VQETLCPPKMQKRRKDAAAPTHDVPAPPRVDKGKAKARARDEATPTSRGRCMWMSRPWMPASLSLSCGSRI
jgi:hypothetical protein